MQPQVLTSGANAKLLTTVGDDPDSLLSLMIGTAYRTSTGGTNDSLATGELAGFLDSLELLPITPATGDVIYFDACEALGVDAATATATQFCLWQKVGANNPTLIADSVRALGVAAPKIGATTTFTGGAYALTCTAGVKYYAGIRQAVPAGATRPGIRRLIASAAVPVTGYSVFTEGETAPTTIELPAAVQMRIGNVRFRTKARTWATWTASAFGVSAGKFWKGDASTFALPVPRIVPGTASGIYSILLEDYVVADHQRLIVECASLSSTAGDGTGVVQDYANIDQRGGANDGQIRFGQAAGAFTENLGGYENLLGTGPTQAANSFNLRLEVDTSAATEVQQLHYSNRTAGQGGNGADDTSWTTTGVATLGRTKGGVTQATPTEWLIFLNDNSTATSWINQIRICYRPLLILGDSNAQVERLGAALETAFSRPSIDAAIAGNELGRDYTASSVDSTAGKSRYKHGTPGQGDLCEQKGVVAVFALGYNDIQHNVTTAALGITYVGQAIQDAANVLTDLASRGIPTVVVSVPPYASDPESSESIAKSNANRNYNAALAGICGSLRHSFGDAWASVADKSAVTDAHQVTWTVGTEVDGTAYGIHYSTAGAATAATRVFTDYKRATVKTLSGI